MNLTIQILHNGQFLLWKKAFSATLPSRSGVVYEFKDQQEHFIAKGKRFLVQRLAPSFSSQFCVPAFSSLEEALNRYKIGSVRTGRCMILQSSIYGEKRIFFRERPEEGMRNSLFQFLAAALRGAEVTPEQNVHIRRLKPVDLRVTWTYSQKIALIEIKWMGKSLSRNKKRFTAQHADTRAKEGAEQLKEYLDYMRTLDATKSIMGYYVILDARRKRTQPSTSSITREDGLFYANREVLFSPEYHNLRPDFAPPIRMFLEPKCIP